MSPDGDWTTASVWLAVVASGLYHGLNPGMGWPLAVSAGLMERSTGALAAALGWLAAGHMLSMLAALLPFALMAALLSWQREIHVAASLLLIVYGVILFLRRGHPRILARVRPSQLALWSFTIAIAHGAGLMLVPMYLGLCGSGRTGLGQEAARTLIHANVGVALLVSAVHTLAMLGAGGAMAFLVYRYLGLKFLSRAWFNLDAIWAVTLILVGAIALGLNSGAMG